jgi:aromatic ring-opening dioxygenase LigB subunit
MLSSILMLPHGSEIIPTADRPYNEAFRPLHEAMLQAGASVAERKTGLIILMTPHGYGLGTAYNVYLHDRYDGLFHDLSHSNIFGQIASHTRWAGERAQAEQLLAALKEKGIPADGLIYGGSDYPLPLGWGESVPLHYIADGDKPHAVLMALPRTRYDHLLDMQNDLAGIGRIWLDMANAYPGNVCLVSSADLAHTHSATGPYGFHESAAAFDALLQQWVHAPKRETIAQLLALQPTAKACGMSGLIMLQTILEATGFTCVQATYACPTYFGMMVARWS